MNIRYKFGNAWVEVEADTLQEIFRKLTGARQIFSISRCGICDSEDVYPNHRKSSSYDFYEMKCECGAAFSFGETRESNTMFPKRKDKEGNWLPNHGWVKYEPKQTNDGGF